MKEKNNLPDAILHHIPWDSNSNPIWPASSFFLHRNIAKYPFPGKLNESQSLELLPHLQNLFLNLPELQSPLYIAADALSPQEKEFLCEHFLCQQGWQNTSKGQGFIVDQSAHFLATLNIKEHLVLQWVDCKGQWEKAWEALNKIETSIGNDLEYAFSPRFGYLTSHPTLCGTSLLVLCYLHLPALILSGKLSQTLHSYQEESVHTSGLFGAAEDFIGDFLILQNKYTLGITEESILKDLHTMASQLVFAEKNERLLYEKNPSIELKDKMSRAYGLLLHSYQLETVEALNALSQIKLGIDLRWVEGITDEEINELLFRCRRAHLLQSNEKISLDKKELAQARASYLHEQLQKTTLKENL